MAAKGSPSICDTPARSGRGEDSDRSAICLAAPLAGGAIDEEIVQLRACTESLCEPSGPFAATRPGLARVFRVPIFRKDLRIRAAATIRFRSLPGRLELAQPLLECRFLRDYSLRQFGRYAFMECPQFVCGHGSEAVAFHRVTPRNKNRAHLPSSPRANKRVRPHLPHSLKRAVAIDAFKTSGSCIQAAVTNLCPLSSRSSDGHFALPGKRPCLGVPHLPPEIVKFGNALGHQLQSFAKKTAPQLFTTSHYNS
jgi:hypothetical protein